MTRRLACLLVLCLVFSGCALFRVQPTPETESVSSTASVPDPAEATAVPSPATAETTLTVGLYPYVPRVEQFETALRAQWSEVRPDVALKFLTDKEWDGGYSTDPPPEADVFVFDAMFFEYFRSQGWLQAMDAGEIQDLADFLPYAIDGLEVEGHYYAIPQLGCANILFYEESDTAMAEATTLSEVRDALGQCTYTSETPPDRRGLMVDLSGGTTSAGFYLDAINSQTGEYPPKLPWTAAALDADAIDAMRALLAMASYENGTTSLPDAYERGEWFSNGWGRALIGFTESMSAMDAATRDALDFKVMPLSDNDRSSMFYADVIGVNPTTNQRGTQELAIQLANVMASSATMIASIGPDAKHPYPQYLMATRPSVFESLGRSFPIYHDMFEMVSTTEPQLFSLNARSRDWLVAMKDTIRSASRQDYPCGCDFQATEQIVDNAAAANICNTTCSDHGGWTGAWTNAQPATPEGTSACGCRTCPVS